MSQAIKHTVKIGDISYTLVFKFGTIRLFEQALGRPLAEALPEFRDGMSEAEAEKAVKSVTLDVWSSLFWAVLQPGHRMTQEGTDDLIDEAGPEQVVEWLLRGIAAYNRGDPALMDIAVGEGAEGNDPAPETETIAPSGS